MNFGEEITPETSEEIADYEAMYKRKREKEKASEPKISFVETGLVELSVKVPNLLPQNANLIARDVRRTLENCAALRVLDEFAETQIAEYTEVPVEEAN